MSTQIISFRPSGEHEWSQHAACAELGAPGMFPHDTDTEGIKWAKQTCLTCPVMVECLTEALDRGERFGVWGGLTTDERDTLRRRSGRRTRSLGVPPVPASVLAEIVAETASQGCAYDPAALAPELDAAAGLDVAS